MYACMSQYIKFSSLHTHNCYRSFTYRFCSLVRSVIPLHFANEKWLPKKNTYQKINAPKKTQKKVHYIWFTIWSSLCMTVHLYQSYAGRTMWHSSAISHRNSLFILSVSLIYLHRLFIGCTVNGCWFVIVFGLEWI